MDFFQKKERISSSCKCAAYNNAIYKYTFNDNYVNTENKQVDILILLEHKEVFQKIDPFLKLCKKYFNNINYAIIPALGCTPNNFSTTDTINTYSTCKELHIKEKILYYNPKIIITTGRALYTITENKNLKPEHFFVPVNDALQTYQIDDTWLYSPEFNCKVFPIPALYQWIDNFSIKDVYEYKFVTQQFERALIEIKNNRKRIKKVNFINITDPNRFLQNLIDNINIKAIAIDTETSGFNYFKDTLYSIQLSYDGITGYFLQFKDIDKQLLIKLFDRKDIIFIYQNAQFDIKFFKANGIYNARCDFELMLASHILNENNRNDLKSNAWLYTKFGGYENKLKKYMKQYKINDFTKLPSNLLLEYACMDAIISYILYEYFSHRLLLEDSDLSYNYYNYIIPAVEMIIDVEMTGVQIDFNYLNEYVINLKKEIFSIEKELYKIAGEEFNIKSSKDLSRILLSLPTFKVLLDENGNELRTKTGELKLDKETLIRYSEELKLPFIKKISQYNHYTKELSQLGFSLENKIKQKSCYLFNDYKNNNQIEKNNKGFLASIYNGRLYGGYKLHGTETGRMAGGGGLDSSINWQNMPATLEFRKLFLPSENYVIGRADYDAMEVSITSQIAGTGVLESLLLEGKDMHCYTGISLYEMLTQESITYEEMYNKTKIEGNEDEFFCSIRTKAKGLNFQGLYGATKYGISQLFKIPVEEGEKFLDAFFKSYPEVKIYIDESREFAKKNGYVKTLLGRKKRLPELTYIGKDSWKNKSSFSINNLLNSAINAPVQGTSGQTTLIAMTKINKYFKENNMKSRIIINVHDEIVFEIHNTEIFEAEKIIKKYMEYPYYKNKNNCKVNLSAGLDIGEIWKAGRSIKYWTHHQSEWNSCLESIKNRNINNKKEIFNV